MTFGPTVWEFKAPPMGKNKKDAGHQPAGLAFMATKGWRQYVKQIILPKDEHMKGRIAIMHFSGFGGDIAFVIVYCYPMQHPHVGKNAKIWTWILEHIEKYQEGHN